ncbi:MAG: UDP-N-acetylmuramate dehydrogenase [Cytophagales bacterium]|nr:UDP-N-acetylmuramate dehydrogenase [Cytophagales bacterium]MCA6368706.1 UDP-N-acetylmuramate dehydrogenase [Cytophagales bacterium]MCA6373945.1 UDP-N-acetylmuramate dehydrogenase [Cytophagales bacterium]MCA6377972.1 UDP-N-acetylmuramate dehydrogenase [Cytophagales bacterium]MCA6382911.1 UDP-N-acetylmuramate dehydrogenase [Cytophagales bacterium]
MTQIEENKDLEALNTFGFKVSAKYFATIHSKDELQELIHSDLYQREERLILGGGSNILFKRDYDGLVIKVDLKGITVVSQTEDSLLLQVASGEVWHELVLHCVKNNWGGIENLSLIPGLVGAAPIQNIGAYGTEIKNMITQVEAIDLKTGLTKLFTNEECCFGYRESVFKNALREKYFISSITLTLTKKNHRLNTSYGAIHETLSSMNIEQPTIKSISDAVIAIRQSKLPDPRVIGNAGSFFKNPSITVNHYQSLQKTNTTIPSYPSANQEVKVPAGWLIEQCGWKGKKINHVGVHPKQALVLVNYGDGKGEDVFDLAVKIASSVKEKFNIELTPEVNIIE